MKKIVTATMLTSALLSANIQAEEYDRTGWYIGGNLGYMDLSIEPDSRDSKERSGSSVSI